MDGVNCSLLINMIYTVGEYYPHLFFSKKYFTFIFNTTDYSSLIQNIKLQKNVKRCKK